MCDKQMEYIKYELNKRFKEGWSSHTIHFRKNCDNKLVVLNIRTTKFKLELSEKPLIIYRVFTDSCFPLEINLDKECDGKEEMFYIIKKFIEDFEGLGGLRLV